jgi:uncharacterized iron-regulated protein
MKALAALAAALVLSAPARADLPAADVVILGEVHGNPAHHAFQARAVAALRPAALVFEMLLPEQAARADPALVGDPAALAAALGWDGRGWPDFALYHPILAAAPGALVVGGDVPRAALRQAMAGGAAVAFGPDAARYGLTEPLAPEDAEARKAQMAASHCNALPEHMLAGMVEAQRLRDAALARAAVEAHAATGGPVAVITGTGHARRDWGIPAALAAAAPGLSVLAVAQVEGAADPADAALFDRVVASAPVARGDPCAAFR